MCRLSSLLKVVKTDPGLETDEMLPGVNQSPEAATPRELTQKPEYLNLRLRERQTKDGRHSRSISQIPIGKPMTGNVNGA